MKVNGLATKGKVLDNPFGGKAVTAYCAGLAVCFFHKVTLIQPEVYPGNTLLDIYHIKIICEYLWKDTTQQLFAIHNAKVTNTYEIMCMRGRGCNWVLRLTPKGSVGKGGDYAYSYAILKRKKFLICHSSDICPKQFDFRIK